MIKKLNLKILIFSLLSLNAFIACNKTQPVEHGEYLADHESHWQPTIGQPATPSLDPTNEAPVPIEPEVLPAENIAPPVVVPEGPFLPPPVPLPVSPAPPPPPPPLPIVPGPVVVKPKPEEKLPCEHGTSDCNDDNPCTKDYCNNDDKCVHELDKAKDFFGSCDRDKDPCTLGKCVQPNSNGEIFCFEQPSKFIAQELGGCMDDNQCTADSCIEVPIHHKVDAQGHDKYGNVKPDSKAKCVNENLNGLSCFVEDKCKPGMCMESEDHESKKEPRIRCVENQDSDPEPYCPHTPQTANNPCKVATCTVGIGCEIINADDDEICDDNNPCTTDDKCSNGVCQGFVNDCDDGIACTKDICDGNGGCEHLPDTSLCDKSENECQQNICDEENGCTLVNVPQGYSCDDGDPCTVEDSCDGLGVCVAGEPKTCADDDVKDCLVPVCTENVGCEFINAEENQPCNLDNNVCTLDLCNDSGECIAQDPIVCADDGNPCTQDLCDEVVGCIYPAGNDGESCEDKNPCTFNTTCLEGSCQGGEDVDCDDGVDCTEDICDGQGGCQNIPNNNLCAKSSDACLANVCDITNGCMAMPVPLGFPCSDDNPCTLEDTCNGEGTCSSGPERQCNDQNTCTLDACNTTTGNCDFIANTDAEGNDCDDGLQCTIGTTCDGEGNCQGGTMVECDDLDPNDCQIPVCSENGGCGVDNFVNQPDETPCDDGDICTQDEFCTEGACGSGMAVVCKDDDNPCTNDEACETDKGGCNWPDAELTGTSCDDGNACTINETCDDQGACIPPASPAEGMLMCPDDVCQEGFCDIEYGCKLRPLTGPYGDSCTTPYVGICADGFLRCEEGVQTDMCEPIFRPDDKVDTCTDPNGMDDDCDGEIDECDCPEVQGTARYVAVGGNDTAKDCTVEMSPCATIANAIGQAVAGDTIVIAAGTYLLPDSIAVDKNLLILGDGPTVTIVNAQQNGEVFGVAADVTVTFCGLTITRGAAKDGGAGFGKENDRETFISSDDGGGIYVGSNATANVISCIISDNSADGNGGGVYSVGTLNIEVSIVQDNTADSNGGGIYNDGGTATISTSTISGNAASTLSGGGIYNLDGTTTISTSTISENTAFVHAGGIYNDGGTATISTSTISGNAATSDNGGGIYNNGETAIAIISNSTISGNTANSRGGGGVYNDSGMATITTSTVSGNMSLVHGGGIYNENGTVNISTSTVSGNMVNTGDGGGVFNIGGAMATISTSTISGNIVNTGAGGGVYQAALTMSITNSTITNNTASSGGSGIYLATGTVEAENTIVAVQASGPDCNSTITDNGFNLESSTTCGFTNNGQQNADPKLGSLQNNGGPTETHALLDGSDAIDMGDTSCGEITDQRGEPRPVDFNNDDVPKCDIGAFERQNP